MKDKKKKKIKFVTLIWEEVPESISFFVIPISAVSREDMTMLNACHNNWINSVSSDTTRASEDVVQSSLNLLSNMILDPKSEWITEEIKNESAEHCNISRDRFDEIFGKWHIYKLDMENPRMLPRSKVYRSGFFV